MEIDLSEQKSGRLWTRRPESIGTDAFLRISRFERNLQGLGRRILFSASTASARDSSFAAVDRQGRFYVFNLSTNSFALSHSFGTPSTTVSFSPESNSSLAAVALTDRSVRIVDLDRGDVRGRIDVERESVVQHVDFHPSGRFALLSTARGVDLWDVDGAERRRTLRGVNQTVVKAFFLDRGALILTCFQDDSIVLWDSDSMQCICCLPVPNVTARKPSLTCFCEIEQTSTLVAGGKAPFLYFWNIASRKLIQVFRLPEETFREISALETIPDENTEILAVLAVGRVHFVDVHTLNVLASFGEQITHFSINVCGQYMLAVRDSHTLELYSLHAVNGSQPNFGPPKIISSQPLTTEQERFGPCVPRCVDRGRLQEILSSYKRYPMKYRNIIWSSLLQLPKNHSAYENLVAKGTHAAFETLPAIPSRQLRKILQRTLSGLAHLSPLLGQVDYLPFLVFPFVKAFRKNPLIAFEISATVLTNWARRWFEFFPNPPITLLNLIENLLSHHDDKLLQHLITRLGLTAESYAWPLMQSLFSEVLLKLEWLQLWDHLFSQHPAFFLYAVVAYLIGCRAALLKCQYVDDFVKFLQRCRSVNIDSLVKEMYVIQKTTPEELRGELVLEEFRPLAEGGQYFLGIHYPTFTIDYLAQERKKMWDGELQCITDHLRSSEVENS